MDGLRVNFRQDFWDCYQGLTGSSPLTIPDVFANAVVFPLVCKVANVNMKQSLIYRVSGDVKRIAYLRHTSLDSNMVLFNVQSLNRQAATIKESGSGSVPDLSKQLLSKRIAVTVVRKQMDLYEVIFLSFFLAVIIAIFVSKLPLRRSYLICISAVHIIILCFIPFTG